MRMNNDLDLIIKEFPDDFGDEKKKGVFDDDSDDSDFYSSKDYEGDNDNDEK